MRSLNSFRWPATVIPVAAVLLVVTPFTPPTGARGEDAPARPAAVPARAVSFLREVRPILAQHCFQCHGPDEAARKGKLRLDLKDHALAERKGAHVIAPKDPDGSLVWERVTTDDPRRKMPPEGAQSLTEKQLATLKLWIEQGAKWEEHWSFVPATKPAIPRVADRSWVRDPFDAFVLARLEREGMKPESEATREGWIRRVSFDLTGLPPTPAEIDEFVKDTSPTAYEKVVDRLLASPRYGERQAQEWLDVARYADTGGYQSDVPRQIWKWREWVINAYNANMPFDRFVIEQLAGDLLPNPTLDQRVATGFNRNHPTNSEAGEEEDEYRSAYVIDRVNTTATAFLGLTMACAQCHDHKYDPISQRDFYAFYSFFNNIKERDADFMNPRPTIPVPNPDQAARLADLQARIAALKARLERDDPLADTAQKEWEKRALARLGKPLEWTTAQPAAYYSRNGAVLKLLDDGSILSTGATPTKDTYELTLRPGKRRIAALRLEVLPDPSQPHGALGRAADGRFSLSAIEVRHTTIADSQDPPLVYMSRAEADINQKPKEDSFAFDMFPGAVESVIVIDPIGPGGGGRGGSWSIVGDERKRPHEAVFLPLEPIETNEASVLRVSLHHLGDFRFRSLIGRFRISYAEDDRVRQILLPAQTKLWSSVGPFPAEDAAKAYSTVFEPEKDIKTGPVDVKKRYEKVVLPPKASNTPSGPGGMTPTKTGDAPEKAPPPKAKGEGATDTKDSKTEKAPPLIPLATDDDKPAPKKPDAKTEPEKKPKPKPEYVTWTEQPKWRDGTQTRLSVSGTGTYYLTRKVVSTRARTVMIGIDGPAGIKMWLNGEPVRSEEPPPPPAPPTPPKPGDPQPEPEPFDFEAVMMGRNRGRTEKKFRIGLREGENEIVVKVVLSTGRPGGGESFTFNLTPEGDDVVTHEVATALRLEEQERNAGSGSLSAVPVAPAPRPKLPTAAPAKAGESKSVGIAGEKTAPSKAEEENPLTQSERRQKVLREFYRARIDPVGRVIAEELAKLKEEEAQFKREMPVTLVMEELDVPRQAYIFIRGLYKSRGADVDPGSPGVLPPMAPGLPRNRLGLAKWLVSGQHPLTARVLVNRVWQQYFGIGLVRTAEDFGIRGELPTHPELLDYLATELVDSGWDQKKLHKRIVLSATYRQTWTAPPEKLDRDPENRLLARGPRLRLTAEMVRDNALAVSGLLFEQIGGPSIKPVQPKDAWKGVESFGGGYRPDRGEKQYRRALYVFWKRGAPYPSMLTFDAVPRDTCTVTRAVTTTPLQALTLLNDPVYVECAKMLGQRMLLDKEPIGRAKGLSKADEDDRRLAYGFRLATSRAPTERQLEILRKLLADQRAHFKADVAAAKKLLAVGEAKIDDSLDPAEAAAWACVGSALLNLDATVHR